MLRQRRNPPKQPEAPPKEPEIETVEKGGWAYKMIRTSHDAARDAYDKRKKKP